MTRTAFQPTAASVFSESIYSDQLAMEASVRRAGLARLKTETRDAIKHGRAADLFGADQYLATWLRPVGKAIEGAQQLQAAKRQTKANRDETRAFTYLNAELLAVLVIHEAIGRCTQERPAKVAAMCVELGRVVLDECRALARRRGQSGDSYMVLGAVKRIAENERQCLAIKGRFGWVLVDCLMRAAMVDNAQPAFTSGMWGRAATLELSRVVADRIKNDTELRLSAVRPRYMPMIVPPVKRRLRDGGYLALDSFIVNGATREQKRAIVAKYLNRQGGAGEMGECMDALNSAPWRVNQRVLRVMHEAWNRGIDVEGAMSARRGDFKRTVGVADQVKDFEQIYFPHFMDWRGRCYPQPQYLNHYAGDVCRGLLEWAVPREPAIEHLKIEAANLFGEDKLSFADRCTWAEQHASDIARCARDPIGCEFWRQADKPWQFLAACFALDGDDAAARAVCRRDGTCNGLQHYAAMGRDAEGAAVVNLLPGELPADVYSDVASVVKAQVAAHAAAGDDFAKAVLAASDWRRIAKQPTMTTVYGVTDTGIREQLEDALAKCGIPADQITFELSIWLSRVVSQSTVQVSPSAQAIMAWLKKCAAAAVAGGDLLQWETPLGFPVVQPYRVKREIIIRVIKRKITLHADDETLPIKKVKHARSFAPNVIHSIDATHMLMTARQCRKEGITFAAVHDSYWTHAAHVDRLGAILREQFVILHSRPLLDELKQQLESRYGIDLPDPPATGTLDIEAVKASPYFFS